MPGTENGKPAPGGMSSPDVKCLVVLGPTATGKTRLGVYLARRFGGEIVSADSRQVYRGLDIGTGKDLHEYTCGGPAVPFHLIDVVAPGEEYNLHRFMQDARRAIADIAARGKLPLIVGGTPLYINALLENYQLPGGAPDADLRQSLAQFTDRELAARLQSLAPELYARTDRTQRRRLLRALEIAAAAKTEHARNGLPYRLKPLLLAPLFPRSQVHARIAQRLQARLNDGLLTEVQRLHDQGLAWERLEALGLEYRFAALFLQGRLPREQFESSLLARIRRLCRAQDIWFRKMERAGWQIHWIPQGDQEKAAALTGRFLQNRPLPPPAQRLEDIRYGPRSQ